MKFRKKPIIVEAVLWTGDVDNVEAPDWLKNNMKNGNIRRFGKSLMVKTLHGITCVIVGDYIVKTIKGDICPCNPILFELTHEKVGESEELCEN